MDSSARKRKEIELRIESLEDALDKAREYLKNGSHSNWKGFRPLFTPKVRGGEEIPPHKDWVKNVFIPNQEKALRKAENILDCLE